MKIVAISDLHGNLPEIPECDLLLIAGDILPTTVQSWAEGSAMWLDSHFRKWLEKIGAPIIGVAGNHDFIFQENPHMVPELPWTYLEDSSTEIEGFKIYGSPWQPWFFDWAFNLTEEQLAEKWELIPDDTDILVLHGPPRGFGDYSTYGGEHTGSQSLLQRVMTVKPKLVVFGHIHEGRGEWECEGVKLANVTVVNSKYEMVYDPWTVEL